jgi:hypothetical protein
VAPFIILNNLGVKTTIAIIGALWTISALILSYYEKNVITVAAKIQDEFDTRVFDLPWNKILLGDHISDEAMHSLSVKFKGEVEERWYGDLNAMPFPFNIIISQRSNVVWDWRLMRNYYFFSLVALIIFAVGGIVLSIYYSLSLENYITTIFLPSSSAYILGFKEIKENFDNYNGKQTFEKRLNAIIDGASTSDPNIDVHLLRQVQDVVYSFRKCPAVVPTWFHNLYRKSYDKRMQAILNKYSIRFSC